MGTPTLSFVLPVYNERESLPTLHQKIAETMAGRPEPFVMVFVDDGSTDGSIEVLTALHQRDSRVKVVQFRRNFGKSAAYSAGFEQARGAFIITMDTDLQKAAAKPHPLPNRRRPVGVEARKQGSLENRCPLVSSTASSDATTFRSTTSIARSKLSTRFRNPYLRRAASLHPSARPSPGSRSSKSRSSTASAQSLEVWTPAISSRDARPDRLVHYTVRQSTDAPARPGGPRDIGAGSRCCCSSLAQTSCSCRFRN